MKIHCINRVAPSLRVRRVLPWQQWRKEAAVAGAPERWIGDAAEVCLVPRELVMSVCPPSNYQQAPPRPAKDTENNQKEQCLRGSP